MTNTTNFIAELIRGANTMDGLSNFERRRLLDRGHSTAVALRSLIVAAGRPIPIEVGTKRATVSSNKLMQQSDQIVAQTLLALAEEIRQLRIINHQTPTSAT